MKHRIVLVLALVCVAAVVCVIHCHSKFFSRSVLETPIAQDEDHTKSETVSALDVVHSEHDQINKSGIGQFSALFSTPITFCGKVVDQFGAPVSGATVSVSANDNPSGHGTKRTFQTDAVGLFSIKGMHGMQLYVEVSKPGYYFVARSPGKPGSYGGAKYAAVGGDKPHQPDKSNPTLFLLHRPGLIEPLERFQLKRSDIPKDGSEVKINIASKGSGIRHEISIKLWTDEKARTQYGTFDWSVEIMAIDGGFLARSDKLDFTAPEDAYERNQKIIMPATLSRQQWKEVVERSYFLRFDDGTFARADITAFSSGGAKLGGVEIKGFLNSNRGSRNLEADPDKN